LDLFWQSEVEVCQKFRRGFEPTTLRSLAKCHDHLATAIWKAPLYGVSWQISYFQENIFWFGSNLFARYFVASSATNAALDIFLARTLILEDADMNHSGDFGTYMVWEMHIAITQKSCLSHDRIVKVQHVSFKF